MKRSVILRQQRKGKFEAQKAIYDLATTEGRGVNEDEKKQLKALDGEIVKLDEDIKEAEEDENRQLRLASSLGTAGGASTSEVEELGKIAKRFSYLRAAYNASEGLAQTGVEKEMNDEALREASALKLEFNSSLRNFSIPSSMVRATTQSVTQDSGKFGGELVTQSNRIVEEFIPKLILEEVGATLMTGLVGNVALPKFSNYEYSWLDENESINLEAQEVGGPVLKPKRAGAGVNLSKQLLLQTSEAVENIVMGKFKEGAARALNRAAINGAGGKAPLGILNMAGINLSKVVAEKALSREDVIELWSLVAASDANVGNASYVLNSILAAAAMDTKKDAGSGRFLMDNGMIEGSRTVVTNLVEELGGLQTLIYGDFSELFIGQWGGVNFTVDPYTGAGAGLVRLYSDLYADIQCANPKAFAVNKFVKA
ncbi:phage major capsid protein [Myroides odoratimimus]|uniref:phage major capsid protein n=1 Tax=Myroides odoratimimus TaxID=76832 RepID=UPI002097DCEB|nr:phage major capsid protein [Myroides odoratimimus]MCO7721967.1 phage major capsid protein [Myroides odoratimimus]